MGWTVSQDRMSGIDGTFHAILASQSSDTLYSEIWNIVHYWKLSSYP